mmetsp:Transcript_110534/g.323387  ORF Transcript_110534/g.323387 Transcript_110534/m.323387 type:complete len:278 (-) Transcript_110534:147-980(-)
MAFLKNAVPIIRGKCDVCGDSRNLWVSEMGAETVPCSHRDRGCLGHYQVAYTGPKAFLPRELENVQCTCGRQPCASGGTLAALLDMGFPEATAREAAARCDNVDTAVEWLTASGVGSSSSADAGSSSAGAHEVSGECAICTEDLSLADAAMRCQGNGGKRHYFHAHCLTAWVRQCRSTGLVPTCPECRGPVQVRPRRLEEFLQEKGRKLDAEDQEAMRTFTAGAETSTDESGWSNLRHDLWKASAILAIGAGLAFAIGVGVHALANRNRSSRHDDER